MISHSLTCKQEMYEVTTYLQDFAASTTANIGFVHWASELQQKQTGAAFSPPQGTLIVN